MSGVIEFAAIRITLIAAGTSIGIIARIEPPAVAL